MLVPSGQRDSENDWISREVRACVARCRNLPNEPCQATPREPNDTFPFQSNQFGFKLGSTCLPSDGRGVYLPTVLTTCRPTSSSHPLFPSFFPSLDRRPLSNVRPNRLAAATFTHILPLSPRCFRSAFWSKQRRLHSGKRIPPPCFILGRYVLQQEEKNQRPNPAHFGVWATIELWERDQQETN